MPVVAVGLTQEEAPLEVFERLAIPEHELAKALRRVRDADNVEEAVVLSTCVRTEVYAVVDRFHDGVESIQRYLCDLGDIETAVFGDGVGCLFDDEVPTHLFRVAAGLASPVPGETEVLGQVRRAWERAVDEGASGPVLAGLFRYALRTGKRARTETAIARGVTSLSHAAVALATARAGGSLTGRSVVAVGAGTMASGIVDALAPSGAPPCRVADLVVANRTLGSARRLAERAGGRAVALGALADELVAADVLITSVTAPAAVVEAAAVAEAVARRRDRPLLIVDVGVPRNVDRAVGAIDGVTLLDMDDIRAFVDASIDGRRREVERAQAIVDEEVARYKIMLAARGAAPVIAALRARAEEIRRAEVFEHRSRLGKLDERQLEAVESLTQGILGKLLHEPTVRLRDAAGTPAGERLIEALRALFEL